MRFLWHLLKVLIIYNCMKETGACNDGEFQCEPLAEKCVPTIWMCDGRNDCPDGSDEHALVCHQHSGSGCFGDQPECVYLGVTRCIMHEWLCDGRTDCDNNMDESNCTHVNVTNPGENPLLSPIHLPSRMQPGVSLAEVIRQNNNIPLHGCQPFEFQCKSGECIIRDLLCDDRKDCPDGSDESEERCSTPPGLPVVEPPHEEPDDVELPAGPATDDPTTYPSPLQPVVPGGQPVPNEPSSTGTQNVFEEIPNPEIVTEAHEVQVLTSWIPKEAQTIPSTVATTEFVYAIGPDSQITEETRLLPVTEGPPPPPAGMEPMANTGSPIEPLAETSTLGMPAIIPLRGLLGIPLPNRLLENPESTTNIERSTPESDEERKLDPIIPFVHITNEDSNQQDLSANKEVPSSSPQDPVFSVTNVLPDESFGHGAVQSPLSVNLVDEEGVTTKIFVDDNLIPIIPINAPENYRIMFPIHATIKKRVKIYTSNHLAAITSTSAGVNDD